MASLLLLGLRHFGFRCARRSYEKIRLWTSLGRRRYRTRVGRRFFLLIPLLTTAAVAGLVLTVGAPRPIESARLFGGPSDSRARFTGWLETWTEGVPRAPGKAKISGFTANGTRSETLVSLDQDGQGEFSLDFGDAPPGPFRIRVERGGRSIVEGEVDLPVRVWRSRGSQRGGFYRVASRGGGAVVRIAPARGAFAVPFAGPLWIRVEEPGAKGIPNARVELSVDGAAIDQRSVLTDLDGFARVSLTPSEHVVSLQARVLLEGGEVTELSTRVPIVPGAFNLTRRGDRLHVSSPVERSEAFVTLVTEEARLFGARVPLKVEPRGTASGELALPPGLPERVWAVAESTRGGTTRERLGWPLFEPVGEPALTLDVGDQLLLDGFPRAAQRERLRQKKVGRVAVALGALGAVSSALGVLVQARQRRRGFAEKLERELAPLERAGLLSRGLSPDALAMSAILLGFMITALFTAWRLF